MVNVNINGSWDSHHHVFVFFTLHSALLPYDRLRRSSQEKGLLMFFNKVLREFILEEGTGSSFFVCVCVCFVFLLRKQHPFHMVSERLRDHLVCARH